MREYPYKNQNQRPNLQLGLHRPATKESYATQLVRIILLCMNPDIWPSFILTVTEDYAPDIQVKLYAFVKAVICAWAGHADLSREDAAVIEDCRKICDVMGWAPEK